MEQGTPEISRVAIVIGINEYPGLPDKKQLKGAENDASEIADTLETDGKFRVNRLIGKELATVHLIRKSLNDIFVRHSTYEMIIIYYAGHGIIDLQGGLYLAASDMEEGELFVGGISIREIDNLVSGYLRLYHNQIPVIVVLDCCHSAIATSDSGRTGQSIPEITNKDFISSVEKGLGTKESVEKGKIYLTSSASTQISKELSRPHQFGSNNQHYHGAFSYHLIEALNGGAADEDGEVGLWKVIEFIDKQKELKDLGQEFTYRFNDTVEASKLKILTSTHLRNKQIESLLKECEAVFNPHDLISLHQTTPYLTRLFSLDPNNQNGIQIKDEITLVLTKCCQGFPNWLELNRTKYSSMINKLEKDMFPRLAGYCTFYLKDYESFMGTPKRLLCILNAILELEFIEEELKYDSFTTKCKACYTVHPSETDIGTPPPILREVDDKSSDKSDKDDKSSDKSDN